MLLFPAFCGIWKLRIPAMGGEEFPSNLDVENEDIAN